MLPAVSSGGLEGMGGVPGGSGAWLTVMTSWALGTGGGEGGPSSRLLLSPCGIRGGGVLNLEELEV